MAKLNRLGIRAKDIDRIFDNAIRRIAEGEEEFSCCAIESLSHCPINRDRVRVRRFYENAFAPRSHAKFHIDLRGRIARYVGIDNTDKSQGFRILMLSLVKAAWRDLV